MKRQDIIEKFFNELSANPHDIKAETLVNQALQHHLHPDDFVVLPDGRFYREYRTDLYSIDKIEDSWLSRLAGLLQLRLSRSGLYDLLPEGLFHQSYHGGQSGTSAAELAAQSRNDQKKENA